MAASHFGPGGLEVVVGEEPLEQSLAILGRGGAGHPGQEIRLEIATRELLFAV
jgi:hypothetical protein